MKVFVIDGSALVRGRLKAMISELKEIEIIGQAQDADHVLLFSSQPTDNLYLYPPSSG
jgi:chemotaxis response regulator CheB